MVKLIVVWCGISVALGAVWAWWGWRSQDELDALDAEWLAEQVRQERTQGIEGVCWRWPVRKIENEQSWRQTDRLRRRA